MTPGLAILVWTLRLSVLALLALTVLPFVHTGWWVRRPASSPRLHFLLPTLALAAAITAAGAATTWNREPWFWLLLCASVALWQASHILRFTSVWPAQVRATDRPDATLVIANLDFRNQRRDEALRALEAADPDLCILIEIDRHWADALEPLRRARPHRVESVRPEGLGIALWSRAPLHDTSIHRLVSDQRPSVHAAATIAGQTVHIVGLHPTPPGLPVHNDEGRHDSRIRDAELMRVAEQVAQNPRRRWIIAGDFNDVAWSPTTRLFIQRSKLRDPRVGRGLLNTYHADYPLLRYPLDHVFVSESFRVGDFQRFRLPGSDHFAVSVQLRVPDEPPAPAADHQQERKDDARQLIREGTHDAAELHQRPSQPQPTPSP